MTSVQFIASVKSLYFFKKVAIVIVSDVVGGCSARDLDRIGLLEEIPRSGVQIPCLT